MLNTVLDFMIFFKRMVKAVFFFSFYYEDCFDWVVFIFNPRICVCECPVGVNFLQKALAFADVFFTYI